MTDLTEAQAAQTVKLVGATGTGTEANFQDVDSEGSAKTKLPAFATMTNTRPAVNSSGSLEVLAANADRKYAMLINNTTDSVWLKFGATAVANQGHELAPKGGFYEIGANNLYTGAVNGIKQTPNSGNLDVMEGTT